MAATSYAEPQRRLIPLYAIVLLALAIHGPLLFMQLPSNSFDSNFHIFFASHYAQHWWNPWNEKWFAGFSQTTYPPLEHQWMALVSHVVGLNMAYAIVQLIGVLLLPVGIYRFSKLWVDERSASYAAIASVFVGALSFLLYEAGQLSTTIAAALFFNALPDFYDWIRSSKFRSLLKGVAISLAGAAVHHVTLVFGAILFALPVIWLAVMDRNEQPATSVVAVWARTAVFTALTAIGTGIVLLPYWLAIIQHPIKQIPIPHASRSNLLTGGLLGINYFLVPYGALLLAFPYIFIRGGQVRRLRPLLVGFWITFILGLGGTTPMPKWLLGRAFDILTFERFTFWATLLALPFVGLLTTEMIARYRRKGALIMALGGIGSLALALGWLPINPYKPVTGFDVKPVIQFLNRDGHDRYRYLTLGFGNELSKVGTYTVASSVDGEYNSARLLPEFTQYGTGQLTSAKYYGTAGMASLRAMLEHANRYGLKYIFVRDPYYDPLLVFAGWRKIDTFDSGLITVWSKESVPPAHPIPSDAMPAPWQGVLWGTLPMATSIFAILFVLLLPERKRAAETVEFPAGEPMFLREAR
ncbi:MAG TPA: hypothetical protein VFA76_00575 [Terriglobales bacterium]|nr:hypothetical protein [Terriglobales bacterium]